MVGDGEPLGQRHRGVLGDGVPQRADLGEQSGGRCGVEQVALAPGDHRREHGARRVHVGQDVHLPQRLQDLVGLLDPALGDEAGVGAEQVDRAEIRLRRAHQRRQRRVVADVERRRAAADGRRHRLGCLAVSIGHHDVAGAGVARRHGQRGPDAGAAAGHHHHLLLQVHERTVGADVGGGWAPHPAHRDQAAAIRPRTGPPAPDVATAAPAAADRALGRRSATGRRVRRRGWPRPGAGDRTGPRARAGR